MTETKQRITREVIVKDYEYMADNGKGRSVNTRKEIVAVYCSPTNADSLAYNEFIKELTKEFGPEHRIPYSTVLQKRFNIQELRNVDTEKELGQKLYEISDPNLLEETDHNLQAIVKAIEEDISPKSTPAK